MNVSLRAFWECRNWKDSAEQIQHNDTDKLPLIRLGVAIHPPLCFTAWPNLSGFGTALEFQGTAHLESSIWTTTICGGHFPQPSNLVILGKAKGMEVPFRAERHHCPFNIFSILRHPFHTNVETIWENPKPAMPTNSPTLPKPWGIRIEVIITCVKISMIFNNMKMLLKCGLLWKSVVIDSMHVSSLTMTGKLDSLRLTCFILWWGGFLEKFLWLTRWDCWHSETSLLQSGCHWRSFRSH